jgi:purine-binding chemotaxis protein CheW
MIYSEGAGIFGITVMLLLIFRLGDQHYALHAESVERVLRIVEITPLADAPRHVLGVVNVNGRVIPVFDVRGLLGLPAKETDLADQFILARVGGHPVALLVDGVSGVTEFPVERTTEAGAILPGLERMEGVAPLGEGLVVIEDLERICSPSVAQLAGASAG